MRMTYPKNKAQPSKTLRFLYETKFGGIVLRFLTCKFVSAVCGAFLSTRFSALGIKKYVKKNGIDLRLYEERKYRSFNEFFTRRIRKEFRPFDEDPQALVAPCDGKLSVYRIGEDLVFNVKDFDYTVESLLRDETLARKFRGGYCLVFRLCVDDYHRYFYFDDCKRGKSVKIRGRFHTVQPVALEKRRVFCENTREYVALHTEHFGDAVQMEVGAMMVGRIVNYEDDKNASTDVVYYRGQEKGKFEFGGSTVIVLLGKDRAVLDEELLANTAAGEETVVHCGERLGYASRTSARLTE